MKSLNRVMLLGNVGNDPAIKFTASGKKVASLSLATNERWKDKAGKKQEQTYWHRLIAWEAIADVIEKYVHKGSPLLIEGSIRSRSYEKDGETRNVTEILVSNLVLLGAKPEQAAGAAAAGNGGPITDEDIPF